ncbi:MAG TPA: hypothetical protein H9726_02900 [Candidatus Borkfalkia avicola]|uniref:Uncharacterized protein n=1 Tax=Candidatus Borkfalkia avicola TaxID=2838503 RepID=A0A9D2IIB8_9FIRM|nr:hypothetical protein [Candidatus Borkfalkia avicola]
MKREARRREAAEERERALVREVTEKFAERQKQRRMLERGWELNMNFLSGNQYVGITPAGELEEEQPRYYWQCREVFNHIAPAIDTRCAKLAQVRPVMSVRAATGEEGDMRTAKISSNVLRSVLEECSFDETMARAAVWSETCGTSFYKVLWDASARGGEGGVCIAAVPPFEIYPEDLSCERVEDQPSIIHARAMPVAEISERYGIKAAPEKAEFPLAPYAAASNFAGGLGRGALPVREDCALVIEYYEKPTRAYPKGRFLAVAGGRLAYEGELPYCNGEAGERGYPFAKQCALEFSGAFFGGSIIDRMIPVQRAFNAVKNRKHEFLNRLTAGVLAVEDGSVDTEELIEEGLPPGKVLVYRQGAPAPKMLAPDSLPSEFQQEEERLLDEFILVSGVSELSSTTQNRTHVTSATGLQLLIELDDTRLAVTTDSIRRAVKKVGRQVLRLMRQFAGKRRLMRMTGEGKKVEMYYFSSADISSDDVVFETENEGAVSPSRRRSLIYEMYDKGLFAGEDGSVPEETRERVLDALGFGGLDSARGLKPLHRNKAAEENLRLAEGEEVRADFYDDDDAHISEHTRFLLSDEFAAGEETKARIEAHLKEHARRKEAARQQ